MYAGVDFDPQDVQENELFTVDFANDLDTGETVVSAVWTLEVAKGTDATPNSHIFGPNTCAGTKTTQRIKNLVDGVKYRVEVVATTSNSNQVKLHSYLPGKSV